MSTFRGKVQIRGDEIVLEAGGVKTKIDGDRESLAAVSGLFVTLKGEQDGAVIRNAELISNPESALLTAEGAEEFEPVIAAIQHLKEDLLAIDGVIGVRPGYSSEGDNGVQSPAIIVLTKPGASVDEIKLPVEGVRTEKREATPQEMLPSGIEPLTMWEGLIPETVPQISYVPPTGVSLDVTECHNITCHVGPDSGWKTLRSFLEGTTEKLTVAMYEFYADHIVKTVNGIGEAGDVELDIILQVDAHDINAEEKLRSGWQNRLKFTKASVSGPQRVFNNSYHTKIAVRDSSAFWLSSGNWSPSSQPDITGGSDQTLYNRGNREWHVIVKDAHLAKVIEKFIEHDIAQAAASATPETLEPSRPDLLIPEAAFNEPEAAVIQPRPFEAKEFAASGAGVRVQPLMSPDNYANEILKLIREAKKSLYLQFSYIRQPSTATFDEIIIAVSEKMRDGLDVRVLVGRNQKAEHSDRLIQRGWKRSMFRLQTSKLHNKGILIDGKIAVVGSNNWSSDGTQYNRDASLVFFSRPIAQYFTEVFMFDWDNLSRSIHEQPEFQPLIAPESGPTPLGMVRIPWRAWFDD